MNSFVTRIAGVQYSFSEMMEFRCDNCSRTTLTGLCGCSFPSPIHSRKVLYGTPTDKNGEVSKE